LNKHASLFDFYHIFSDVISEWRSKEKKDNVQSKEGYPNMYLSQVSILQQAVRIYTINMYKVFKVEYVKRQG